MYIGHGLPHLPYYRLLNVPLILMVNWYLKIWETTEREDQPLVISTVTDTFNANKQTDSVYKTNNSNLAGSHQRCSLGRRM